MENIDSRGEMKDESPLLSAVFRARILTQDSIGGLNKISSTRSERYMYVRQMGYRPIATNPDQLRPIPAVRSIPFKAPDRLAGTTFRTVVVANSGLDYRRDQADYLSALPLTPRHPAKTSHQTLQSSRQAISRLLRSSGAMPQCPHAPGETSSL